MPSSPFYTPPIPAAPETLPERDARLLAAWKAAPLGFAKDRAATALLSALGGSIGTALNAFRGAPMPQATVELEAKRYALEACASFNPVAGMTLSNYVITNVKQRLYRYVATHANVARLPEAQVAQIGSLREATTDLTNRFGREPTAHELSDYMSIPVAHVTRLRSGLRADLLESGPGNLADEAAMHTDPNFEAAMMAYYSFTPNEQQVFDFSVGTHGQPQLSTNEIAKRMNVSAARISQLKKTLADKIRPHLDSSSLLTIDGEED